MPGIKKTSLSQTISDILRTRIISGGIVGGEHLNEAQIAEELGVSRGPVREALTLLEAEGMVIKASNGRAIAAGFNAEDIRSYYKMRQFIESEAVRQILSRGEDEEFHHMIQSMEHILNESRNYMNEEDMQFTNLDSEFHLTFIRNANQIVYTHIWSMLNNLNRSIMELNRNYIRREKMHDANGTYQFHDHILQGLKNRDLEYTLAQITAHLEKGVETYTSIVNRVVEQYQRQAGKGA